jgi:hypothetical protein
VDVQDSAGKRADDRGRDETEIPGQENDLDTEIGKHREGLFPHVFQRTAFHRDYPGGYPGSLRPTESPRLGAVADQEKDASRALFRLAVNQGLEVGAPA